jgi:hypothetical protein
MLNRVAIQGTAHCVVVNEKDQSIQFNLIFPQRPPLPHGVLLTRGHKPQVLKSTSVLEGKYCECAGELVHSDGHLFLECHYIVTNFEQRARQKFKRGETNGETINSET